jgi:23S rRNA (uracil1939-C5)-methyltransferase
METGDNDSAIDQTTRRFGSKATYAVASAGSALRSGQALGSDVLIVDPPRKGLEDDVLDELCKPFNPRQPNVESPSMMTLEDYRVNWTNDVQTLIYVSCGFDALARDCEKLLSSPGRWKLESVTGYVLFPGSNHVETLCIFKRD